MVETSGKVKVATGLTSQGQGHQTVFAQIVADELGVPIGDVEVVTGDTRAFGYAVGTFASRAAVMSGSAIALAARAARAKAIRVAAAALEASPDDLEIVGGKVQIKGDPGVRDRARHGRGAVEPAAVRVRRGGPGGDPVRRRRHRASRRSPRATSPGSRAGSSSRRVRSTFANGMHAVIVETDPQTAEIKVLRYCVVHDCGTLINPRIVEGQIHGGVAQGVGGALYERMAYDETGQLQNASFMDFLMPYVSEVPPASRSTTWRRRRRSTRSASRARARPG